jgi:hypothetical protein
MELVKFDVNVLGGDLAISYINPVFSNEFKNMNFTEKRHLLCEIIEEAKWQLELAEDELKREYKDANNVYPIK